LHEQIRRVLPEALEPGPKLRGRLLRKAKKKIREINARIQTRKYERAPRVGIDSTVGLNAADVSAEPNRLSANRLDNGVAETNRSIDAERRIDIADAADRAE
jgi:hypothetical protein